MKYSKIVTALSLGILLFTQSVSASWWNSATGNSEGFDQGQSFGGRGGERPEMGEKGMKQGTPPGMELSEGWEDMTDEEKQMYMEENRPEGMREGQGMRQGGGMELPEDWEDMTDEEKQEYMEENRPEGNGEGMRQGGGMELPEDWEDMTDEEKQEYMEENRPERNENEENYGQQVSTQRHQRNFVRKAVKGENYQKFTGTLRSKKNFSDSDDIENEEAVTFLQQRGILDGYEDGTFGPQNPINRAESLKVLLEALGEDPDEDVEEEFSDVSEDAWYAGYVSKAKAKGIVNGYEDGTFRPGKTVNQVELLKLAFESFGIDLTDYEVSSLPEGVEEDAWYAPYLQYALDNELLDEEDVSPSEGMTREMFSELIYRLIQQQESLE